MMPPLFPDWPGRRLTQERRLIFVVVSPVTPSGGTDPEPTNLTPEEAREQEEKLKGFVEKIKNTDDAQKLRTMLTSFLEDDGSLALQEVKNLSDSIFRSLSRMLSKEEQALLDKILPRTDFGILQLLIVHMNVMSNVEYKDFKAKGMRKRSRTTEGRDRLQSEADGKLQERAMQEKPKGLVFSYIDREKKVTVYGRRDSYTSDWYVTREKTMEESYELERKAFRDSDRAYHETQQRREARALESGRQWPAQYSHHIPGDVPFGSNTLAYNEGRAYRRMQRDLDAELGKGWQHGTSMTQKIMNIRRVDNPNSLPNSTYYMNPAERRVHEEYFGDYSGGGSTVIFPRRIDSRRFPLLSGFEQRRQLVANRIQAAPFVQSAAEPIGAPVVRLSMQNSINRERRGINIEFVITDVTDRTSVALRPMQVDFDLTLDESAWLRSHGVVLSAKRQLEPEFGRPIRYPIHELKIYNTNPSTSFRIRQGDNSWDLAAATEYAASQKEKASQQAKADKHIRAMRKKITDALKKGDELFGNMEKLIKDDSNKQAWLSEKRSDLKKILERTFDKNNLEAGKKLLDDVDTLLKEVEDEYKKLSTPP